MTGAAALRSLRSAKISRNSRREPAISTTIKKKNTTGKARRNCFSNSKTLKKNSSMDAKLPNNATAKIRRLM